MDGVEIANGYWELQQVSEHVAQFAADLELRKSRGLQAISPDANFLAALEQGLPDCAGVALGFDRLVMLALGLNSLDEVLSFRR